MSCRASTIADHLAGYLDRASFERSAEIRGLTRALQRFDHRAFHQQPVSRLLSRRCTYSSMFTPRRRAPWNADECVTEVTPPGSAIGTTGDNARICVGDSKGESRAIRVQLGHRCFVGNNILSPVAVLRSIFSLETEDTSFPLRRARQIAIAV